MPSPHQPSCASAFCTARGPLPSASGLATPPDGSVVVAGQEGRSSTSNQGRGSVARQLCGFNDRHTTLLQAASGSMHTVSARTNTPHTTYQATSAGNINLRAQPKALATPLTLTHLCGDNQARPKALHQGCPHSKAGTQPPVAVGVGGKACQGLGEVGHLLVDVSTTHDIFCTPVTRCKCVCLVVGIAWSK